MDTAWLTVLLSNDRWLFIEYFWVLWSLSLFFFIHLMFMVPKCVLLPNLATPPVGFGQTRPPVLLQLIFYFFCTQENSSPSTSVLKLCPSFPFLPPFHALQLGVRTSSSACSTPLYPPPPPSHSAYHVVPSPRLASALPEMFSSASTCFYQVPILSTETVIGTSISVRSFPALWGSGGTYM